MALDQTPAAAQPHAFAVLLDRLAEDRHDHLGWVLTPSSLIETMVRLADPQPGETVVDPCCGYGELLVGAGLYSTRNGDRRGAELRAVVHDERARRLTMMNAQADHLTIDVEVGADHVLRTFPDGSPGRWTRADVVLTNPPFTRADWTDEDPARQGAWPYGPPPRHEAAFAWLQIAQAALTSSGRAVVVMPPHSLRPRNPRERRILRNMVEDGVVRCVIDLPGRMFRETSTPVSIWVLGGPQPQTDRGVLLIDARDTTSGEGSTHRVLDAAGKDRILKVWNAWSTGQAADEPGFCAAPSRSEIRDRSYVLTPSSCVRPASTPSGLPGPARHDPRTLAELHGELVRLHEHARHLDASVDAQLTRIFRGGRS
ncbi:MAG TPA: N-6 DNA methylase [Kineosporiaceae bacterium]